MELLLGFVAANRGFTEHANDRFLQLDERHPEYPEDFNDAE
jgi:hypothetical protein